ncbi:4-hydroxy-tetrahydrodipicolinate synthase, chloroplastic-like isoform X1 [Typha latifolia]|uniref:4-hydroxy-tetrahydrodipicolinate synthase, chloroplastic-like isoform X1 n=3 Tax=Typha latifolia TaxID=4733 RepID=UPI003C30BD96
MPSIVLANCDIIPRVYSTSGRRRWRSTSATLTTNTPFPMHSLEVKRRTSMEGIKDLRLITAIKTPYLPDGRLDLEAYDSMMQMQIDNGVEGVVIGGTTGEGHLLNWDERIMLIGHTMSCFGKSVKVIGSTGSNSTREAIRATEQGFATGMHAALQINPYYGKTSAAGLVSHFESVLCMGPTIIYNVPSRTGHDIPPHIIDEISRNTNMVGIKECAGNDRIKDYVDKGFVIWSGNDDQCHDARWVCGANGVISVATNLIPGLMHEIIFRGMNPSLNTKLMPLIEWLFCEPNPLGLNTALAQLGVVRPIFRMPYVPLPFEKRVEFVGIVEAIGREHFVGEKDVQVLDDNEFILLSQY